MDSSADVLLPRIGNGAGAVMRGGSFNGGGYEAAQSGDVLTIPHASTGLDLAKGTIVFDYIPNYDSQDDVKRNILLVSEWTKEGFHLGKHGSPNQMRLYFQFRGADRILRDVFVLPSDYDAWVAGTAINWRISWDVSRAPDVLRVWQDGCELAVNQSAIPQGLAPGNADGDLWVGGGDGAIHGDGTVTDLLILSRPVADSAPSCP